MRALNLEMPKHPQRMWEYWKKEWRAVLIITLTGTIFNAAMSAGPVLQGRIIDLILNGEPAALVIRWIAGYLLAIFAIQVLRFLKRYYIRLFANRTNATMRFVVYHNIMNRPVEKLKGERAGDLMTRGISDVKACAEGMRKATTEVFDTGVLMIAYVITLLGQDLYLTLGACLCIPLSMAAAGMLKQVIFRYTSAYRKQLSLVTDITYEMAENSMLYRITGTEARNLKLYGQELKNLEKKAILSNMLENSMQPIYKTITLFGVVGICYFGGKNVIGGSWTVGDFSAYLAIFTALAVKASKAAKLFNSVQKAQVSWERVKPFLKLPEEERRQDPGLMASPGLVMSHMSFTYPGADKPVVEDVSFEVLPGQMVGVTGPVASGKSTLGLALQGLYSYDGDILIGGVQLRDCPAQTISAVVSYMGHDSQLLSDTIYNNITLGDEGDIRQVLADVCFEEDLASMPEGADTLVGASGVRLSGGQQARLALARALYHRGSLLVLDDPFSAVDQKTEQRIIRNLRQHYGDCAILLISHRVSCFEEADKVVLVNRGRTICRTHSQLMEESPVYQALFNLQKEEQNHA